MHVSDTNAVIVSACVSYVNSSYYCRIFPVKQDKFLIRTTKKAQ